jgi:AraC-like DNA-binding protein
MISSCGQPADLDLSALATFRLFESSDLDETCARMSHVLRPHDVRPERAGRNVKSAHMDTVRFAGTTLSAIDYGRAVHVAAPGTHDYFSVIFCTRGTATIHVNGRPTIVDQSRALLTRPGDRIGAHFSADCEQLHLRIAAKSFLADGASLPDISDRALDLRRSEAASWLTQIQLLVRSPAVLDRLSRDAAEAQRAEYTLIELLRAALSAERRAPGWLRAAEAFIERNAAEAIDLSAVAAAAGVPPRTLHHGFRQYRNRSPIKYLTEFRLDRARENLLEGRADLTVTTVALDGGFTHLSRFAHAYAARFGEKPSETLNAARNARRPRRS